MRHTIFRLATALTMGCAILATGIESATATPLAAAAATAPTMRIVRPIYYGGTPAYRACVIAQALRNSSGRGIWAETMDAQITCAWAGFTVI